MRVGQTLEAGLAIFIIHVEHPDARHFTCCDADVLLRPAFPPGRDLFAVGSGILEPVLGDGRFIARLERKHRETSLGLASANAAAGRRRPSWLLF